MRLLVFDCFILFTYIFNKFFIEWQFNQIIHYLLFLTCEIVLHHSLKILLIQRMNFTCKVHFFVFLFFLLEIWCFLFFVNLFYICIEKLSFHFLSSLWTVWSWVRSALNSLVIILLSLLVILFSHFLLFHLLMDFEGFRIRIVKYTSHVCFVIITWIVKSVRSWSLNIVRVLCCLDSAAIICYLHFSWSCHFEIDRTLDASWSSLSSYFFWIISKNRILSDSLSFCSCLWFAFVEWRKVEKYFLISLRFSVSWWIGSPNCLSNFNTAFLKKYQNKNDEHQSKDVEYALKYYPDCAKKRMIFIFAAWTFISRNMGWLVWLLPRLSLLQVFLLIKMLARLQVLFVIGFHTTVYFVF